jgi:hypothetical protein
MQEQPRGDRHQKMNHVDQRIGFGERYQLQNVQPDGETKTVEKNTAPCCKRDQRAKMKLGRCIGLA